MLSQRQSQNYKSVKVIQSTAVLISLPFLQLFHVRFEIKKNSNVYMWSRCRYVQANFWSKLKSSGNARAIKCWYWEAGIINTHLDAGVIPHRLKAEIGRALTLW